MKLRVKPDIEIKDIINSLLIIVGGVLTYVFVNSIDTKNDTIRTKQLLLEQLPKLYPELQINYTNEFSEDKKNLHIRVYLKNLGEYPTFVSYPSLFLINGNDTIQFYNTDLKKLGGLISPDREYRIEYVANNYSTDSIPNRIGMIYHVKIDENIVNTYGSLLSGAIEELSDSTIYWITNKDFKYAEQTYSYDKNPIWDDFFENPR